MQRAVKENMPHRWREHVTRQGRRVFEDRKSGHHLDALLTRKRALGAKSVGMAAFFILTEWAQSYYLDAPVVCRPGPCERFVGRLLMWLRAPAASDPDELRQQLDATTRAAISAKQ
eukprot:2093055-Prymnesium_polylepis.1